MSTRPAIDRRQLKSITFTVTKINDNIQLPPEPGIWPGIFVECF